MATYTDQLRQGLPRTPGGEAWPPAGTAPINAVMPSKSIAPQAATPAVAVPGQMPLRRGLPRVAGGEPWPPAGSGPGAAEQATASVSATTPAEPSTVDASASSPETVVAEAPSVRPAAPVAVPVTGASTEFDEVPLRRGLPRTAGGDPWPPEGVALVSRPVVAGAAVKPEAAPEVAAAESQAVKPQVGESAAAPAPAQSTALQPETTPEPQAIPVDAVPVAPVPAEAVATQPAAKPVREPWMLGSRTLAQWVRVGVYAVLGLVAAAGLIVLAARGVTTLPGVPEFLERYPGEYALPAFVADGFPAWARWTHFLNFFFMVLIVQSGLRVRRQQKPPAFYTPKRGGKKVSIHLWLHTSLDVLWLVNGVVFVVLLFVSGHWARIVPTSWEVFPNALSAGLQYLTLEWPHEDGWVNYNSLQQLMYFAVVFLAAPLAAISGARMSEWWPKNADALNKIYPAPLARAIHFPTMLFFVVFVIIHVFLVFSTGALKNLNHMFAGTPEVSWAGFWWFAAGLVVAVGAAFATRPLVVAPIAGLSGTVSQR